MEKENGIHRLQMIHISKEFPGVKALSDVSFSLLPGEIHALVGENGAGKSTLMKILSGAYQRDAGTIKIDGEEVNIQTPSDALDFGIVTIYQETNLCPSLSVAENIFLGRFPGKGLFVDWRLLYKDSDKFLATMDTNISSSDLIGDLSTAQRQMVEIVKALSLSAKIIVFDEPTASLSDKEVKAFFKVIQQLQSNGVSIIFITHRINEVFEICDRVTVLRDGNKIATNNVSEISEDEVIVQMIGRKLLHPENHDAIKGNQKVLEVRNFSGNGFNSVSFDVNSGEVLGLFGLVGSGRTELMRAIFGAEKIESGDLLINGKKITDSSPPDSIKNGVVLVPEDRKHQGLILNMSVKNNISLPNLANLSKFGFINFSKETKLAIEYKKNLDIRCPSVETEAKLLSGGNQQKVVIAKWLAKNPKVLIVDEPTRGIDVSGKIEVYRLINDLISNKVAVILVSSELPEILAMSDRILVMHEGQLVGELSKEMASEEKVMRLASGFHMEERSFQNE